MSKVCANTIKEAFQKKDFSAGFLKSYEKRWWEMYGKYSGWGVLLRHYTAKHFKSKDWNIIIGNLKKLNDKEKEEFLKSEMTYPLFNKLTSFFITKDMLQNRAKETFPNLNSLRQRYFVSHFV